MKKKRIIRYMIRDPKNDKKDFKAVKFVSSFIEGDFVKRFSGVVGTLMGLTPSSNALLIYLTEIMDDRNRVRNTTQLKKEFNSYLKRSKLKCFSDTTINRSFKDLADKNILYKLKRLRGLYRVNPEFFHRDTHDQRIQLLRFDLEKNSFYAINTMRALTYEEDMVKKKAANGK